MIKIPTIKQVWHSGGDSFKADWNDSKYDYEAGFKKWW